MTTKDALFITITDLEKEVARLKRMASEKVQMYPNTFDRLSGVANTLTFLKNTLPKDLEPRDFIIEQDDKGQMYPVKRT